MIGQIPTPWTPMSTGDIDNFGIDTTLILKEDNSTLTGTPIVTAWPNDMIVSNVAVQGTIVSFTLAAGSNTGIYTISVTFRTTTRGPLTRRAYLGVRPR